MIEVPRAVVNPSKVLSLVDWGIAYDFQAPRSCFKAPTSRDVCRLDGDTVGLIRDWSRNARDGTQATTANQPAFQIDLYGQIDGISTVGSDDTIVIGGSGTGNATAVHGFIVLDAGGIIPASAKFLISGDGTGDVQIRWLNVSGDIALALGGVGVALQRPIPDGIRLVEYRWAANSQYLRVDNNSAVTATNATAVTDVQTRFLSFNDGTASFEGNVYGWWQHQGAALLDAGTVTAVRSALVTQFYNEFAV